MRTKDDILRTATIPSMRPQLELKHISSCTLLPNRSAILDRMPRSARVVEFRANGDLTSEIVRRCRPSLLLLIDTQPYGHSRHDVDAIRMQVDDGCCDCETSIFQGLSHNVLDLLDNDSLDWAFIDTDHALDTTLLELQMCDRLVSQDGRIAVHDAAGSLISAAQNGVTEAVNEFCMERNWGFEFLTVEDSGNLFFCLERLPSEKPDLRHQ